MKVIKQTDLIETDENGRSQTTTIRTTEIDADEVTDAWPYVTTMYLDADPSQEWYEDRARDLHEAMEQHRCMVRRYLPTSR